MQQKELLKRISQCKLEVKDFRTQLNQLDQHREHWFEQKSALGKEISKLITKVKSEKETRDKLTRSVKELKQKRDELNKSIKDNISEVKKLRQEKEELIKKLKVKSDPERLKQEIERLELRIETEALPFEQEKKIMEKMRRMKKELKDAAGIIAIFERIKSLSEEIDNARKEAERTHQIIQLKAGKSQEFHEQVLKISEQIGELKKKEKDAQEKFLKFKEEFTKTNDALKEKLMELSKLNEQVEGIRKEGVEKKRQKEEKFIMEKEKELEEKMRRGKKIKTEDLLIFQKSEIVED